jgi:putative tryptophan/tyrosine transport system substrate-binding protein
VCYLSVESTGATPPVKRREFMALIGGAAVTWPLGARAQQAAKLRTIGLLFGGPPSVFSPWTAAFVERLRALGWIEARTITIEYRWSEGLHEREAEIAAEFVRLKVDVILTDGPIVPIIKQTTAVIPIVFALASDPVGGGLVASLARPGGNVTGLSLQSTDLAGKKLELLREAVPHLRRLAILVDVGFAQSVLEMGEVQAAARTFGIGVTPLEIRRAEDIAPSFERLNAQADALYGVGAPLIDANRTRINGLALAARLPTIFSNRGQVQAGGLMSTEQASPTYSGAPPIMSTRFCAAPSQRISRSSSRPSLTSSSTSRPRRRSVSRSRRQC